MASDSDVDEDELLQMALQEQAARDLSHQRPPAANKPVVNLVRPPAPNARGGGGGNARGAPAKERQPSRGGDEDDDSEVELLSISSGDEDDNPRARGPPPPRAGASGGRAGARRAASRDDGDIDDDEPRSWKRVDEAEVGGDCRDLDLVGWWLLCWLRPIQRSCGLMIRPISFA
jgi:exocyst complex component 2